MFYASDGRLGSTSSFRSQDIRITPLVMKIMVEMTVSVATSAAGKLQGPRCTQRGRASRGMTTRF